MIAAAVQTHSYTTNTHTHYYYYYHHHYYYRDYFFYETLRTSNSSFDASVNPLENRSFGMFRVTGFSACVANLKKLNRKKLQQPKNVQ